MKKVLLLILDGYGIPNRIEDSAITEETSRYITSLKNKYPNAKVSCSGEDVGLPEGQMGNSEVGHLNIGAGRVVYQELTRITKAIRDGVFYDIDVFHRAAEHVKKNNSALHIMGLVSDGGVHSSDIHYKALIEFAKKAGLDDVYVHCFMDGRDTYPKSGAKFLSELNAFIDQLGFGTIASVSGRYYAMDRDKRYNRIKKAYDAIVSGDATVFKSADERITTSYDSGVTDEFILPALIADIKGNVHTIDDGDAVIFFNFRPDRARQLSSALMGEDFDGFSRQKKLNDVYFVSMCEYDSDFDFAHVAFPPQTIKNTLGEYLSGKGYSQLRLAETEKYAHVTYFMNGGIELPYENEKRILIPSPKVATYDLKPEMSAYEVCGTLVGQIDTAEFDFITVNYANCDMVGHTGVFEAARRAVRAVDECVRQSVEAALAQGYSVLITADHGNAEQMLCEGEVFTAHTTNKVPLIIVDERVRTVADGRLCDLAPTILELMGEEIPGEMFGKSLVTLK